MMEKRNKHWRIERRNLIYIAKMKLFATYGEEKIINGERIRNARWIDLFKANWNPVYKSVRTPCSCPLCRSKRYNRSLHRSAKRKILDEQL